VFEACGNISIRARISRPGAKSSTLSVLSNAALIWNTVHMAEIVKALEKSTGEAVNREDLALAHAHVIQSGTYLRALDAGGRRLEQISHACRWAPTMSEFELTLLRARRALRRSNAETAASSISVSERPRPLADSTNSLPWRRMSLIELLG
jgi:hypothetical protein